MNKPKVVVKVILLGLVFTKLYATYLDLGNKSISLGSAYTAVSGDVYSIYANPAGLYHGQMLDLKLDLLGSINFTGNILYNVNQIIDSAQKFEHIRQTQQQGGSVDITEISALFNGIKNLVEINRPGKGVITQFNGGIACKIKSFAFNIRNVTSVSLKPFFDPGFSLTSTSSSVQSFPLKSLKFTNGNSQGVIVTTDTLRYPQLEHIRDELVPLVGWIITKLESLGVEVPQEVKDNTTGVANALINLAKDKGVSDEEIKDAVYTLKDPTVQQIVDDFISKMYNPSGSFNTNNSSLVLKGVNYTEFAIGYSYQIIKNFVIGGKLKYLFGKTLYYDFKIFQQQDEIDFNDLTNIENKLTKNVSCIGIDIGGMYKLPFPVVETNVGVVIKNLIEPEFEFAGADEKFKLPRQVTFGVSSNIYKILALNLDFDLNKVETILSGYNVQNLCLGMEINLPMLLNIRLGYLKNLAFNNDQLYTLGLGLKFWVVDVDFTAALYPQKIKINKNTELFSDKVSLGLSLGVKF